MAKIIISSDWHLKFSAQFDRPTTSGAPSRLQEIIDSVLWVAAQGKKHKATMFLGLGDIFDSPERLQTKEGLSIVEMFTKISKMYKQTILIPGNHDCISSHHNILDIFNSLMTVFSKPTFVDVEGARLFFLPYIREPEDFYAAVKSFESLDCLGKKYLFAHFWDTKTVSVDPDAIDLTKVNLAFFDRVFTGHFHAPTTELSEKVIYVGTLLNKRFRESGKKGCWLLDTVKNDISFYENPLSPAFISCTDKSLLVNSDSIEEQAYYRVTCDPSNVLEISKLLSKSKGFELVSGVEDSATTNISIMNIEKKNASSLKEYLVKNCAIFTPEGISKEDFIEHGSSFIAGL